MMIIPEEMKNVKPKTIQIYWCGEKNKWKQNTAENAKLVHLKSVL